MCKLRPYLFARLRPFNRGTHDFFPVAIAVERPTDLSPVHCLRNCDLRPTALSLTVCAHLSIRNLFNRKCHEPHVKCGCTERT